jgi:L-lactate dehydrogenase (cytochrome)
MKCLCITVDVAVFGKRERDQRNRVSDISNIQKNYNHNVDRGNGVVKALASFVFPGLTWEYLKRIRLVTSLPIILKGIQTIEDAILAHKSGICRGIIISNHGGRQVDFARPSVDCLREIVPGLIQAGVKVNEEFDVYVDGGIRRGTDIYKCLALGAKAVGIGRPSLFALASHGQEGVGHLISILNDELKMVMAHMGCLSLQDISSASLCFKPDNRTARRAGGLYHESCL